MAATNTILVPLDGSKLSENALPAAAWLAGLYSAPVTLLHIVDEDQAKNEAAARQTFRGYAEALAKDHGIASVTPELLLGGTADRLLEAAASAAFVVLASRGRGGFRAMFMGSVADKVVRGSTVPVLLVPGKEGAPVPGGSGSIIVGLDGSPEAERALALGREIAAKSGLGLTLVQSVSVPPPAGIEFTYYPTDLLDTLEQGATEYLARTAQPGDKTLVIQGDAAGSILEAAKQTNASLIVLASTGKGLAKRLALGSTTDRVIHSAELPVLIVPKAE